MVYHLCRSGADIIKLSERSKSMNRQTRIIKSLTQEEQELLCFFRPVGYHTRLQQYLEYPEAFTKETMQNKGGIALSTTKTFRRCLLNFIRTFQPIAFPINSALWLHLEKSGCFTVRLGKDGELITGLGAIYSCCLQDLLYTHQILYLVHHIKSQQEKQPPAYAVLHSRWPFVIHRYGRSAELQCVRSSHRRLPHRRQAVPDILHPSRGHQHWSCSPK